MTSNDATLRITSYLVQQATSEYIPGDTAYRSAIVLQKYNS